LALVLAFSDCTRHRKVAINGRKREGLNAAVRHMAGLGLELGLGLAIDVRVLCDRRKRHFLFTARCTVHYSAKRGLDIACRLSVCLSVTLVDHYHIG